MRLRDDEPRKGDLLGFSYEAYNGLAELPQDLRRTEGRIKADRQYGFAVHGDGCPM